MTCSLASSPRSTSATSALRWSISTVRRNARPLLRDVYRPVLALAEQCRQRHAQHVVGAPGGDLGIDPIVVAEHCGVDRLEIEDGAHPLLVDAERRHLGEAARLDAPHAGGQDALTTPAAHRDGSARLHFHRIGRQQLDDDLHVAGIADLEQRRTGQHHLLALVQTLQDAPARRRLDADAAGRRRILLVGGNLPDRSAWRARCRAGGGAVRPGPWRARPRRGG